MDPPGACQVDNLPAEQMDPIQQAARPASPFPFLSDTSRMEITPAEREWALLIKEAVENNQEEDIHFSDLLFAQVALTVPRHANNPERSLQEAVDHCIQLHHFMEQYKVHDTFQDGSNAIARYYCLQPDTVLDFTFYQDSGHFLLVMDLINDSHTDFDGTHIKLEQNMAGIYYLLHALCPDLESIRQGIIIWFECQGTQINRNLMIAKESRIAMDIVSHYPHRVYQLRYFHTGLVMNLVVSTFKRLIPAHIRDKVKTGCVTPDDRRLNTLLHVPDKETAQLRTRHSILVALTKRFENAAVFRLSEETERD